MPHLSVLLPARNAERTVRRAVTTTLRDLPHDAEVVVLDDGSTDGTTHQLSTIRDRRLRVVEGRGEGDLGRALNRLLNSTDSALVARMDADDMTLPGRFASSLAAVRAGADFAFTSSITTHGVRTRPSLPVPISAAAFPFHLLLSNPVRHPSLTAKRSSIESLGGYRSRPSEDYDLWLRAAVAGLMQVKTSWYGLSYRVHASQVSADAEWQERSHGDEQLQDVFSELSTEVLGRPFPRLVRLHTAGPDDRRHGCDEFDLALRSAMKNLDALDRAYLWVKWSRRRRQIIRKGSCAEKDRRSTSE